MKILPVIIVIVVFLGLLFWAMSSLAKQSKKDWDALKYLEQKAAKVKTKEEIELLHKELIKKAERINNKFVHQRLHQLNSYLIGMYQQYKN